MSFASKIGRGSGNEARFTISDGGRNTRSNRVSILLNMDVGNFTDSLNFHSRRDGPEGSPHPNCVYHASPTTRGCSDATPPMRRMSLYCATRNRSLHSDIQWAASYIAATAAARDPWLELRALSAAHRQGTLVVPQSGSCSL